ncbi:EF-hand domain-containing protein [uncultured Algibacter sp.]|uniref:EF-hand domain-containing protein n=1 Tax=uncultured Algibacter sp. TaxID=298659 RepID=UPI00262440E9|nr:EF-hand domain-containing protein [uncultured Algibacter sp.]
MINKNFKIVISAFAMFLCLGVFAQRQGGPLRDGQGNRDGGQRGGQQQREKPDASRILAMLDTNDDDKISKEEASKAKRGKLSDNFDIIDVNDDGFLVLEELETFFEKGKSKKVSPEKIIKKADKNDDGLLSEEELSSKRNRHILKNFKAIDTDMNSQISLEELKVFLSESKRRKPQSRN